MKTERQRAADKKQGNFWIRGLNGAGIFCMAAMLAAVIPVRVPMWLGYEICGVLSGSMEPEYPVGSLVYVKRTEPEEVEKGDVILFELGTDTQLTMLHRVVEIQEEEQKFITGGDANEYQDRDTVAYSRLIGKAVFHLPFLGNMLIWLRSKEGICVCAGMFICSFLCWLWAEILQKQTEE